MQPVENPNDVPPRAWFFLALCVAFQTTSVMLGKMAALRLAKPTPAAFLTNPWYLGGLACLVLQAFAWQLVLREVRLFVAYLAMSVTYFLILAGSRIVFLERVTTLNVTGVVVIITGVYLVIREDLP